ncbi:60S ribosomal L2, mitochondrial [Gossypium arboreum]|uniref:60S ribosomal L2, mitochondrial n=1 Tax=Gossypium arboreum TaxID=29729 RepID=A0A0B0NNL2_GOSAR|nr:60S ribosomal L2, mitochondrial [Gossypium arboreum]
MKTSSSGASDFWVWALFRVASTSRGFHDLYLPSYLHSSRALYKSAFPTEQVIDTFLHLSRVSLIYEIFKHQEPWAGDEFCRNLVEENESRIVHLCA